MAVSRVRVTLGVGTVLFWAVTPVLACLLPCLITASDKQECPYHMAPHCGQSTMAAGRTCCQVSSHPEMATFEVQVNQSDKRVLAAVPAVGHIPLSGVNTRPVSLAFSESPPSEPCLPFFSILRI